MLLVTVVLVLAIVLLVTVALVLLTVVVLVTTVVLGTNSAGGRCGAESGLRSLLVVGLFRSTGAAASAEHGGEAPIDESRHGLCRIRGCSGLRPRLRPRPRRWPAAADFHHGSAMRPCFPIDLTA